MKAITWKNGTIAEGIEISTSNGRTGIVLGVKRPFTVGLDNRNSPTIVDDKISNAYLKKIQPFDQTKKPFFVLSKDQTTNSSEVLLRIIGIPNCHFETSFSNENDELVVVKPGSSFTVSAGVGKGFKYIITFGENGLESQTVVDFENQKAQTQVSTGEIEKVFGLMSLYTYSHQEGLKDVLEVKATPAGGVEVVLGESAARTSDEILHFPVVDLEENPTIGGVGKVEGKFVFYDSKDWEEKKILIRVDSSRQKGHGEIEYLVGKPIIIGKFTHKHSALREIWNNEEQILVLSECDAIKINQKVLYIKDGSPEIMKHDDWLREQVLANPEEWNAKGIAHIYNIPENWIGKLVDFGQRDVLVSVNKRDREIILSREWTLTPEELEDDICQEYRVGIQPGAWMVELVGDPPAKNWEEIENTASYELPSPLVEHNKNVLARAKMVLVPVSFMSSQKKRELEITLSALPVQAYTQKSWKVNGSIRTGRKNYTGTEYIEHSFHLPENYVTNWSELPEDFEADIEVRQNVFSKWTVVTEAIKRQDSDELAHKLAEIKISQAANAKYREYAVDSMLFDGDQKVFAVPFNSKGEPCHPDEAVEWQQYWEVKPWKFAPNESILEHRKGFKATRVASSSTQLIKDLYWYLRGV